MAPKDLDESRYLRRINGVPASLPSLDVAVELPGYLREFKFDY